MIALRGVRSSWLILARKRALGPIGLGRLIAGDLESGDQIRQLELAMFQRADIGPGRDDAAFPRAMGPDPQPGAVGRAATPRRRRAAMKGELPRDPGLGIVGRADVPRAACQRPRSASRKSCRPRTDLELREVAGSDR